MEEVFIELEGKDFLCILALGKMSQITETRVIQSRELIHFIISKVIFPNLQCQIEVFDFAVLETEEAETGEHKIGMATGLGVAKYNPSCALPRIRGIFI